MSGTQKFGIQVVAAVALLFAVHKTLSGDSIGNPQSQINEAHRSAGVQELVPHYKKAVEMANGFFDGKPRPPDYNALLTASDDLDDIEEEDFEFESKQADPEIFVHGNEVKINNGEIDPKEFTIHLIGERHSGTKWMSAHLDECFGKLVAIKVQPRFTRWKHWFQEDTDFKDMGKNAIVIAQFRNPYEWVKAMQHFPYHSPEHLELPWMEFVNRPWYMNPYGLDVQQENLTAYDRSMEAPCQSKYYPDEIVPCLDVRGDIIVSKGLSHPYSIHPAYELRRDRSGRPFNNILELRAEKIRNMVNMTNFKNVYHFDAIKYEGVATHGTRDLVERIEKLIGAKAQCTPADGKFHPRPIQADLMDYLNKHMDWEAEALIGYKRRDPKLQNS